MGQECFYKENRRNREMRGLRLGGRFGAEEWRLRPMSQRENEEIWLTRDVMRLPCWRKASVSRT